MARLQSGTRIYGNAIIDTSLSIDGNTAATSTSTGALKVSGGMGVIGNIYSSGNITVINASLGNIASANYLTGTLTTSSQPNITSVGTLTSLTVTNALSAGTLNVGDTTIAGNLVVTGTTITANVASISVKDPIIEQGGTANGSALLSDDGMDRGQLLHYYSSGNQVNAFMGWKNANSEFVFAKSSTISNNVVTVGSLGNVRADYFIGNIIGSVQTAVSVTNNAQPNITGVGTLTELTVAGNLNATLTTSSQPNITSLGTLTSLNVTGITNLGNIGNIKLYGGSNSYLLKTDGTGNLSWVSPETSSLTSVVDIFSGDGSQTTFTLASAPKDANFTMVAVQGILQPKNSYSVLGTALTFSSAPPPSSIVEVTAFGGSVNNGTSGPSYSDSNVQTYLSTGVTGSIIPAANITHDLGSPTKRFKDLYLSNNTIYLGNTAFSSDKIFPFNLNIAPEVLEIEIAAPAPGDDIAWLWTWQTSTLPYARTAIINSAQISVPMYKQGTYQINNFANQQTGSMTQRHGATLKWIDGAGSQNAINWAVNSGNVTFANPNINGGADTLVQRIIVTVPATVTPPTLVAPTVAYTVSAETANVFTFGGHAAGENKTLGPAYHGGTYTFTLNSNLGNNKFYLTTDNGTNWAANAYFGEYTNGVVGSRNDGTSGKTTLVFTVPSDAPDTLYYQSATNANMRGVIVIKALAVETNINGNYVVYMQHGGEGHKTPIEIRPIPSLVNQMCVVYDQTTDKFVPQDLATYVDNTPSFRNKIREVAGTATLVAPNGVVVVPTVTIVEDPSYLPLVGNKTGDICYSSDTDTMYLWNGTVWKATKPASFPAANIIGTVANATLATYASIANAVAGANVSGAVSFATTANSVAGANVSGQVANALVASTVYTNSHPNITSVGTLTSLAVTNDVTIGGNLTISGTTTTINSTVVSINDLNIVLANNAASAAAANGAGITINGANASMNYLSASNAFVFSHSISANGSLLTSLPGSNVSGTVANATYAVTAGTAYSVASSNITGIINLATFATTANAVAGANVSGTVATATVATSANSVTGSNVSGQVANALISGTVYTNAQPAITSVGTLTSLAVTGNITSGNANLGNLLIANFHSGSGNMLSNIQGANVSGAVSFATTANSVAGANVSGTIANATYAITAGTAYSVAAGNITGTINLATYATTANAVAGANISGQVANALIAGTVYTNAQSNITSVGTLTGLTSNGTVNFSNASNVSLGPVANVHLTGGTTGQVLTTDGTGNLTWATASSGSSGITAARSIINTYVFGA